MQTTLTLIIRMFKRVGIQENLGITKAMSCTPGFIWGQQKAVDYKRRATGEGATFQERKRTRVRCVECRGTMAESSIFHHIEISHGIVLPQIRDVDIGGGGLQTYVVSFPQILNMVEFPVEGCPARENNLARLHENSMYRHWKLKVVIIQEGPNHVINVGYTRTRLGLSST